ncbi:hypothetical protein SNEBB_005257 [Seison nebaliae]|nr:hypothetical protein SNEBB_005257 [Seison nebaliae]
MLFSSKKTSIPSVTICLPKPNKIDNDWILFSRIKYAMQFNCSAEIKQFHNLLICVNFEGESNNYPEWENKEKLLDYFDSSLTKLRDYNRWTGVEFKDLMILLIFLNIYHRENDWTLSMKKKLLFQNYTILTIAQMIININIEEIENVPINKIVLENYFHCSFGSEEKNFNTYLYLLFTGDCLDERSTKVLLLSYLRAEIEKINLWSWKSDPYLPEEYHMIYQFTRWFTSLQKVMRTSFYDMVYLEVQELERKVVPVLKSNLIGSLYLTTNLLLRYYYQTWSWAIGIKPKMKTSQYNLRKVYSTKASSNILSCKFDDRKCKKEELSNFLTEEGNCNQFTTVGQATTLEILINTYSYPSKSDHQKGTKLSLTVNENGQKPKIADPQMYIFNGRSISLMIQGRKQSLLNTDNWGNCFEPTTEFKKKYNIKGKYSRAQCIQECYYLFIIKQCKCKIYHDEVNRTETKFCAKLGSLYCTFLATEIFQWRIQQYCPYCVQECDFLMFQKMIISDTPNSLKFKTRYSHCDEYDTKWSLINGINEFGNSSNYNKQCLNPLNFNVSTTKLKIYFDDHLIENYSQKKGISLSTTLSQIGGSLGICIGGSIFTIFELFYLVFIKILKFHHKEKK